MDETLKRVRNIAVHLALNQIAFAKRMKRSAGTFQEAQGWSNEENEVCELLRKLRFVEMREEEKERKQAQDCVGGTD
mgnify:CR=1 FL=1